MINIKAYVLPIKCITDEDIAREFNESNYDRGFQCLCCKGYQRLDSDYGVCFGKDSILKNRVIFEHFTCSKYKHRLSE